MDENEKQWGLTKVKALKLSYKWTICNFSICGKKTGECIKSPFFSSSNSNIKWYISLYPKGWKEEFKDFISIYLGFESKECNLEVQMELSIVNSEGNETNKMKCIYHFRSAIDYGFHEFIKRDFINTDQLLPDDRLTLVCHIKAGVGYQNFSSENGIEDDKLGYQLKIYNELQMLLENNEITDVTLHAANGKDLYAHKAILAARSPVFLAMFKNNMKEKQESKIEFTDIESDVLTEMLRYMYTGKVKDIEKCSYDLLKVADKYELEGLKVLCDEFLYSSLSINNAVEILVLADRCNCNKLKNKVIKFICTHVKTIMDSPEFKILRNNQPQLILDVMFSMLDL